MNMISYGLLLSALFISGYALSGQNSRSPTFWLSILAAMLMVVAAIVMML